MILGYQRHQLARKLVALANWLVKSNDLPTYEPQYRPVDSVMPGTKWTIWAYSIEHLRSLLKQEGDTYTLAQLLDESGWQEIGPDNIDLVRRSFAMDGIDMDDDGRLTAGDKSNPS